MRASFPSANAQALADAIVHLMDHPDERARLAGGRPADLPAIRHRGVRQKDGAAVHPAARRLARNQAPRRPAGRPVVPRMKRIAVVTSTPLFLSKAAIW